MAVKISGLKPTIVCPARLFLPDDNGTFFLHEFDAVFKRLSATQRDDLHKRYTEGVAAADGAPAKALTDAQMLDEVLEGWGRMFDEHGNPVPYSHAERQATSQVYPGLEQAMVVSYYEHAYYVNQRDAAIKNSKAPSATTSGETTRTAT